MACVALALAFVGLPHTGFARTYLGEGAEWESFTPAADWQFVSGDFDGDGNPDVAGYHPSTGGVWVGLNQLPADSSFNLANWGSVSPASGWTFAAGKFNADALTDVVAYHSSGEVWVGINTGGAFSYSEWASPGLPAFGDVASLFVGDFDGDGTQDLMAYRTGHVTGECPGVLNYENDLSGFSTSQGQVWQGLQQTDHTPHFEFSCVLIVEQVADWQFAAGDVAKGSFELRESNGVISHSNLGTESLTTGADELIGFDPNTGIVQVFVPHVHASTTHLPGASEVGYLPTRPQDVNGDLLTDGWHKMTPASGWHLTTGRVAQNKFDDLDDVVFHHREDAKVWVGISGGGQSSCKGDDDFWWTCFRYWSETEYCAPTAFGTPPPFCAPSGGGLPGSDSGVLAARFSGNGDDKGGNDVVRYDATSGKLILLENQGPTGIGYAWPKSAPTGGTIDFHVSSSESPAITPAVGGPHTVNFYHHLSTGPNVDSTVMATDSYTPGVQPIPIPMGSYTSLAWKNGLDWDPSYTLTIPSGWPSGLYSAVFSASYSDVSAHIPFVVRPSAPDETRVAVLANVNSWLAYNNWGGYSKYDGRTPLSFKRPNFRASPIAENLSGHHLARAELWILGWLEREGYGFDLYTDIDFHDGIVDFSEYTTLIVGTHPEYWTDGMYDRLESFLDGGGSLLYLGGNGIFERGIYEEEEGSVVGMGFLEDVVPGLSHRREATFRMSTRAELPLLGAATESCVEPRGFVALLPEDPLFDGITMGMGALFGATGWNTGGGKWVGTFHAGIYSGVPADGGASGFEVDTHAGPGATLMPIGCGGNWSTAGASTDPAPAGVQVLAVGAMDPGSAIDPGGNPHNPGELSYYDHPAGGLVLSAGSITFGGSLVKDPVLNQLMRNALSRTVPEPSFAIGLVPGLVWLGFLSARQKRKRI